MLLVSNSLSRFQWAFFFLTCSNVLRHINFYNPQAPVSTNVGAQIHLVHSPGDAQVLSVINFLGSKKWCITSSFLTLFSHLLKAFLASKLRLWIHSKIHTELLWRESFRVWCLRHSVSWYRWQPEFCSVRCEAPGVQWWRSKTTIGTDDPSRVTCPEV